MARSRVKIKSVNNFISKHIVRVGIFSQKQLALLAKETETIIRQNIKNSLQRPGSTGNLAESFSAERISENSWGVGNISFLNSKAPYWAWQNYGVAGTGRRIPPATTGSFSPGNPAPNGGDFRAGRFQQGDGFLMKPTKPIQAHNFIQRTLSEIPSLISNIKKVKL